MLGEADEELADGVTVFDFPLDWTKEGKTLLAPLVNLEELIPKDPPLVNGTAESFPEDSMAPLDETGVEGSELPVFRVT